MAQTSTTLISSKSHLTSITGTDISFTATSGIYTIKATSTTLTGSGKLAVGDLITVTGTTNNNSTFTVSTVVSTLEITVAEVVTSENADGSTTVTLDHVGFVSDKSKGDGYYSQPDGVHTVAYQVTTSFNANATIKMQGTLATTPTEDDFFDIANTTFTSDTSTVTSSFNFTGNYVWIRSKTESVTAGTVNSIQVNS
jgi:hypothetical protein|tara:strand:+ start:1434 stop:2024 length:591 start_codon:yes stop_codon:yes gene_type:complete